VVALVWIIRNSTNEPDLPEADPSWRRFVPRIPKRPWSAGPSRRGSERSSSRSAQPK